MTLVAKTLELRTTMEPGSSPQWTRLETRPETRPETSLEKYSENLTPELTMPRST